MSKRRTRHPNDTRTGKARRLANLQRGTKSGPSNKMLAIIQSGAVLPPKQIGNVRQRIAFVVEDNLARASRVLANEEKWSAPQVALFLGLLHKVAPTMTANLHQHETLGRDTAYQNMSRQELEAQLAEVMGEPVKEVIEVEPTPTPRRKRHPPREVKAVIDHKDRKRKRIRLDKVKARILEKPEIELPPLTREQDDENRRQAAQSAKGLRKRARRYEIRKTLDLLGQADHLDPPLEAE